MILLAILSDSRYSCTVQSERRVVDRLTQGQSQEMVKTDNLNSKSLAYASASASDSDHSGVSTISLELRLIGVEEVKTFLESLNDEVRY